MLPFCTLGQWALSAAARVVWCMSAGLRPLPLLKLRSGPRGCTILLATLQARRAAAMEEGEEAGRLLADTDTEGGVVRATLKPPAAPNERAREASNSEAHASSPDELLAGAAAAAAATTARVRAAVLGRRAEEEPAMSAVRDIEAEMGRRADTGSYTCLGDGCGGAAGCCGDSGSAL